MFFECGYSFLERFSSHSSKIFTDQAVSEAIIAPLCDLRTVKISEPDIMLSYLVHTRVFRAFYPADIVTHILHAQAQYPAILIFIGDLPQLAVQYFKTGRFVAFIARSVQGGVYMPLLLK